MIPPGQPSRFRPLPVYDRRPAGGAHRIEARRSIWRPMWWEKLHALAAWGYPFPNDETGKPYLANLRGRD